ncbi:hypothetical protein MAE02_57850 [Microvirga aerophila]|uniref:Uncharacterized protein n=1 Tax=Microvirga aerophila TaxID=670291 RepID=A0A512C1N1_9HYPH|nr:hypothetical protein MAE02_57850 [Microvirga aerophila]
MDVLASFVANGETAEAVEPCQCALHHPTISPEPLAAINAAAGDPGRDGVLAAFALAAAMVVSLVGVQFVRPAPRATAAMTHWRNRIKGGRQH